MIFFGTKAFSGILQAFGLTENLLSQLTTEEKAILCAYYRCKEGCVSDEINTYCAESEDSACALPVALGFYEDENKLKVCSDDSELFPVEFETKGGKIAASHLKTKDFNPCLIKLDDFSDVSQMRRSFVILQGDTFEKPKKTTCEEERAPFGQEMFAKKTEKAYEEVGVIPDKKIFIYESSWIDSSTLPSPTTWWRFFILSAPSYLAHPQFISLEKNKPVEKELEFKQFCPSGEIKITGYRILSDTEKNYGLHFLFDPSDNKLNVTLFGGKEGKDSKKFADKETGSVGLSNVKVEITSNSISRIVAAQTCLINIKTKFKITSS
jgi:hypothetical protein